MNAFNRFSKVRHLGLSERIQSLTISDAIGIRKPKVGIFKVACERADVLLEEAMFVGDTVENDIIGANRAGMTSVFIDRESDVLVPKITGERPDYSISNLYDVLSCL
ncbi:MAG: HAD family hydrolase [Candidatus Poribacteria bacterium]|nr:HAD family hydrolase [Candidatus Poribacteria bacterium]